MGCDERLNGQRVRERWYAMAAVDVQLRCRPKSWSGKPRNGQRQARPMTPASATLQHCVNKHTSFASNIITSIRKRVRAWSSRPGSAHILTSSFTLSSPPWLLPRANVYCRRANAYRPHPLIRHGTRPTQHTSTPTVCPLRGYLAAGSASAK